MIDKTNVWILQGKILALNPETAMALIQTQIQIDPDALGNERTMDYKLPVHLNEVKADKLIAEGKRIKLTGHYQVVDTGETDPRTGKPVVRLEMHADAAEKATSKQDINVSQVVGTVSRDFKTYNSDASKRTMIWGVVRAAATAIRCTGFAALSAQFGEEARKGAMVKIIGRAQNQFQPERGSRIEVLVDQDSTPHCKILKPAPELVDPMAALGLGIDGDFGGTADNLI